LVLNSDFTTKDQYVNYKYRYQNSCSRTVSSILHNNTTSYCTIHYGVGLTVGGLHRLVLKHY